MAVVLQIREPDFYPSWIQDPTNSNKREGEKSSCPTFFGGNNYHKIRYNFMFEQVQKKI
jgi:hypothetical protein